MSEQAEAFNERYFIAPAQEEQSRREQPDHWQRYAFCLPRLEGTRVLDVACGCGYGTAFLSSGGGRHLVGLDRDAEAIRWARQHYGEKADFHCVDAAEWPVGAGTFDTAVSLETLEHVPEAEAVGFLRSIHRALVPGGLLILSTPLNESPERLHPQNPYHLREYAWGELEGVLAPFFEVESRWSQVSRLTQAYRRATGSGSASLRRQLVRVWPQRWRRWLRERLLDVAGMRGGCIVEGHQEMAAVQLVLARARRSLR